MTKDEALKLALEALDCICSPLHVREIAKVGNAMKAIKEALAQPKQEPVAWELRAGKTDRVLIEITNNPQRAHDWKASLEEVVPLYTTPPQRKPLTDEQIDEIYFKSSLEVANRCDDIYDFVRAIEAAHGIKGE